MSIFKLESLAPTSPRSYSCLTELGRQMPFLLRATLDPSLVPIQDRIPLLEGILDRIDQIHPNAPELLPKIVESYILLSLEFLKLQRLLEKSGRYLLSTERASYEAAYQNEKVFGGYYLEGLLLSQALWPNHYRLSNAFQNSFIPQVQLGGDVLEVGVGTGFHLSKLMEAVPTLSYTGLDLSPFAIEFCRKFARVEGPHNGRLSFIEASVTTGLPFTDKFFQNIIMGEVLEHVERPGDVLCELRRVTKTGGHFFMTTVVFAANIDHIYLFHTAEEVRALCIQSGWTIIKDWVYPVYPKDSPDMRDRPMNVGFMLQNRG